LWRAALVASGVNDPARLAESQRKLEAWCNELRGLVLPENSDWERARIVFEFMHRRILTRGYDALCSDVALVEAEGRYNCISSTVLFQSLAERVGLRTAGGESPGHAFCWLWIDGHRVAVETTNPHWFANSKSQRKLAGAMGLVEISATQSRAARELSAAELTAMIYYNRAYLLLRERQFAAAIVANAKALRLDPASDVSQDNLLAALNNWALDQSDRGEFAFAAGLLQHGLSVAPNHSPFQVNLIVVQQRAAEADREKTTKSE
jgi:tetratricopeptide (TPR) repeat protein